MNKKKWLTLSCAMTLVSPSLEAAWSGFLNDSVRLNTASYTFGGTVPAGAGTSNGNYYDGDFADYTGDGLPDRALNSRYGLLRNTNNGFMVPAGDASGSGNGFTGVEFDGTQWADIDNDGDMDNVMGGGGESAFRIQRNTNGQFTLSQDLGGEALVIVNFDLENDGDVDFASCGDAGQNTGFFRIFRNNGSGTFTQISGDAALSAIGLAGINAQVVSGIVAGDVDGDRDMDLILAANNFIVAKNNGSGNFTLSTFRGTRSYSGEIVVSAFDSAVNLGDIDDDGDLDFVVGNETLGAHAQVRDMIFINNGSGGFTEESASRWNLNGFNPAGKYMGDVVNCSNGKLADVDYDGDLDWIGFSYYDYIGPQLPNRGVYIFLNDGTGRFTYDTAHSIWIPVGGRALGADLDITDLNRDGSYDVWVGQGGDSVHILLNTHTDPSGIPANRPRNLQLVSATSSGISISWQHPPFADSARRYKVYRSQTSQSANPSLIKQVAVSKFTDERFSAPITRHTTTAYLGDPDVTLAGSSNLVTYIDRTAVPGITYYYSVAHVGAENSESVRTPELTATIGSGVNLPPAAPRNLRIR